MELTGKLLEKTNNGSPYVGDADCSFDSARVTKWGLLAEYGRRGHRMVAEVYGVVVAVKCDSPDLRCLRKLLTCDGRALSSIRSARTAGIVWDTSGAYLP